MTKNQPPITEKQQLINDKPLTVKEAISYTQDKLGFGRRFFYMHVRKRLNFRPIVIDLDEKKAAGLSVLQSELDDLIYAIKKDFKDRREV